MKGRFKLDEERRAEMVRRWNEGAALKDLVVEFGLAGNAVWRYCETHSRDPDGLTRKQRREQRARSLKRKEARRKAILRREAKADRDSRIRRLWSDGWPGVKLADHFGLSKSSISGIVAGLSRPRRYGDPWDVAWPHPRRHAPRPARPERPRPIEAVGTLPTRPLAPKGSASGRAKLDEAKVARMKRLRLDGWTTGMLAQEFGVGRNTVCYIVTRKNWTHVEPEPPANGGTA